MAFRAAGTADSSRPGWVAHHLRAVCRAAADPVLERLAGQHQGMPGTVPGIPGTSASPGAAC